MTTIATQPDETHHEDDFAVSAIDAASEDHVRIDEDHVVLEAISPLAAESVVLADAPETSELAHQDVPESSTSGEPAPAMTGNGLDTHAPLAVPQPSTIALPQPSTISAPATTSPVAGPAAAEARGLLEGIAESLRTLAGRQGTDGAAVAIFPRGVDLLEVRMHVSREQAIDLNFRVAGPAQSNLSV